MKGVTLSYREGPIPQDTECSGTNNFGYFLIKGPQLPWHCTL